MKLTFTQDEVLAIVLAHGNSILPGSFNVGEFDRYSMSATVALTFEETVMEVTGEAL